MVDFCPECGNMLRKNRCKCGYGQQQGSKIVKSSNSPVKIMWNPPSPNIIYCKITATPFEKLKTGLNKGIYPEKLREIKKRLKKHDLSCLNCVYYEEKNFHCQIKNKFFSKDSICKSFEPFDI